MFSYLVNCLFCFPLGAVFGLSFFILLNTFSVPGEGCNRYTCIHDFSSIFVLPLIWSSILLYARNMKYILSLNKISVLFCSIWTATSEIPYIWTCALIEDSNQGAHSHSLIRSESSIGAFWTAKDATFLHANNEDFDHSVRSGADLSLRWTRMSEGMFSHGAVHIVLLNTTLFTFASEWLF